MDRISYLPFEVLLYILSFIPTIDVVRTSVLSSRWRYHWTFVANIDITTPRLNSCPPAPRSLINSVASMLRGADTSLEIFRLRSSYSFNRCCVAGWIAEAIRRSVRELDVSFLGFELPMNFFTCSTINVLRLGPNGPSCYPKVPDSCCFPNLKHLQFLMSGPPNDLTRNLFRRCPVLEDLVIGGRQRSGSVFDISSPSLKRLTVEISDRFDFTGRIEVLLSTPNLEFLRLHDEMPIDCLFKESLSSAEVSLEFVTCCGGHDNREYVACASRLLQGISGGRMLSLDSGATDFLSGVHLFDLPMFYNLTHLEMTIPRCVIWNLLLELLEHAPILEVLTIIKVCDHYEAYLENSEDEDDNEFVHENGHLFNGDEHGQGLNGDEHGQGLNGDEDNYDESSYWSEPDAVPQCLFSHLVVINVRGFVGEALKLISFLLKNAASLQQLVIENCHGDQQEREKHRRKILSLPRASTRCEMQFLEAFP